MQTALNDGCQPHTLSILTCVGIPSQEPDLATVPELRFESLLGEDFERPFVPQTLREEGSRSLDHL